MTPSLPPQASALALAAALAFALGPLVGAAHSHPTHKTAPPMGAIVVAEAPFLAENSLAMDKMMAAMAVKATGDVEVDFAATMIPHHQGAIDMAVAELRYGSNEQLRRIAQEIIVDQQQEIVAMRLALGQPLPAETTAPTQAAPPPTAMATPQLNSAN